MDIEAERALREAMEHNPYPPDVFSWERRDTNLLVRGYYMGMAAVAKELDSPIQMEAEDIIAVTDEIRRAITEKETAATIDAAHCGTAREGGE